MDSHFIDARHFLAFLKGLLKSAYESPSSAEYLPLTSVCSEIFSQEAVDTGKIDAAALEASVIDELVAANLAVLSSAAAEDWDADALSAALAELPLRDQNIRVYSKLWSRERDETHKAADNLSCFGSRLKALQWRVDVPAASMTTARNEGALNEDVVGVVQLTVTDGPRAAGPFESPVSGAGERAIAFRLSASRAATLAKLGVDIRERLSAAAAAASRA